MKKVFIALGSNQGNRLRNLKSAIVCLSEHAITVLQQSLVYETEPWGASAGQPHYLNQVIEIETSLPPEALLSACQLCEQSLGRTPEQGHMQARVIDIDLLYYGDVCLHTPALTLPHPALYDRMFVLVPLLEIAEDWTDPSKGQAIWELYDACRDETEVVIFHEKDQMSGS
jgi:2-amino-4-hydroxy-6-hydroxymethyldihydropteridine diphosphokinase